MRFPSKWKFQKWVKIERRKKTLNVIGIIKSSYDKNDCLQRIQNITKRTIDTIERRTRGQSEEDDWFYFRRGLITGTTTHKIYHAIKKNKKSEKVNKSISKLESPILYYPAIVWGRTHEEIAVQVFTNSMKGKHKNLVVKRMGLKLDEDCHYIGASVDGLVECSCHEPSILEIKSPYSLRDGTVEKDGHKLQYLDRTLNLKKNHPHYFQLQTYLAVYKLKMGYFCIYTPQDIYTLEIQFDESFWTQLKADLSIYYERDYLKSFFCN